MRRPVLAASTVAAVAGLAGGADSAVAIGDDQGDKNSQLAEAQFEVNLLTNTELRPMDVTCAAPPDTDPSASMLCYALVGDRGTVAALAVLESPGVYRFVSITKVDVSNDLPDVAASQSEVDALILEQIEIATEPSTGIGDAILSANPDIESVDSIDFHPPTATVQVSVSTNADTQSVRDAIAFSVTDVMAYLWEEDEPLRDPSATIQPRLEVTVDDELYGSSFEMMVGVAERTMPYLEWLELSTGRAALAPSSRLDDRRVEIKRKS